MAVSRRLRFEILRRDNHACRYCGATAPDVKLTVDHVTPVSLGGSDDPTNLVTACASCNGGKTSTTPDAPVVADVAQDALRWSAALQRAAGEMLADLDRRDLAREEFAEKWTDWGVGPEGNRKELPRPPGWKGSIDSFMAAGLPMPVLLDCVDKAMGNQKIKPDDTFRYMCGIAWKKVTELQEAARDIVSPAPAEPTGVGQYETLVRHIYGLFGAVNSAEEVYDFAAAGRAAMDPDDDPIDLDDDGFAVVAILDKISALVWEQGEVTRAVMLALPPERFEELFDQVVAEVAWPRPLQLAGSGHLYRETLTAHIAKLAAPQPDQQGASK